MHGIVNHVLENFSSSGFQATWPRPRRSRRACGCRPGQGAHLAHVPLDETTQGKMLPSRACANRLLTNANLSGPWMVRSNLAREDAMRAAMTFERDKRMTADEDFTVQKDAIARGLCVFLDRIACISHHPSRHGFFSAGRGCFRVANGRVSEERGFEVAEQRQFSTNGVSR